MQPVQNRPSIQTQPAADAVSARTVSAVILAGRLRQAPLQEALDVHMLCLPVGRSGTLLEAWLGALRGVPDLAHVRVVVNSDEDASSVRGVLPREYRLPASRPLVDVMAEPASWRGAGGIVRDVTEDLSDDALVLVCEGTRLPPASLDPVVLAASSRDGEGRLPAGVVGVVGEDAPAGLYAFRRASIRHTPRIGYYDMKEQFLPALARAGERVVVASLGEGSARLRDLDSYLQTVRQSLNGSAGTGAANVGHSSQRVSSRASVSGSAILDGFCIIEPGAVVEDGAVVHDSVILWGATVGGGSVVSCSVIGPLASVEARARAVRQVVARK